MYTLNNTKFNYFIFVIFILIPLVISTTPSYSLEEISIQEQIDKVSQNELYNTISNLTSIPDVNSTSRIFGSIGNQLAARYLRNRLEAYNITTWVENCTIPFHNKFFMRIH